MSRSVVPASLSVILVFSVVIVGHPAGAGDALGGQGGTNRAVLAKGCESGQLEACIQAAEEYSLSLDRKDLARALKLYQRACLGAVAAGCQGAGGLLESDAFGKPDINGARYYFRRARDQYSAECERGNAEGCAQLVEMVDAGQIDKASGKLRDTWDSRARSEYGRQCRDGGAASCKALASYCSRRGDESCFLDAHSRACELGIAESCCLLGRARREGKHGRSLDGAVSLEYLERACEGGDLSCCADAAAQYRTASGSVKDTPQAVRLLERGCDGGFAESCRDLASMLREGEGVQRDPERASALLRKACEAGLREACRP